jgi:hypothetical protein
LFFLLASTHHQRVTSKAFHHTHNNIDRNKLLDTSTNTRMRLAAPGGGEVEQRRAAGGFDNVTDWNDGRGSSIAQEYKNGSRGGSLQFDFSPTMILICVTLSICAVVIVPVCYHKCRRWWCGDNDDAIAAEQQRRGELEQNSTEGAVYEEKDTAEKKAAAKKMIKAYMLRKSTVSHCAIVTCCC